MKKPNIIFICLLFLIVCCRKKPGTPVIPISPALLSHFSFKVGTYWIYRDSLTGRVDSFYVDTNFTRNGTNGTGFSSTINVYNEIDIKSKNVDGHVYIDSVNWWSITLIDSTINAVLDNEYPELIHYPYNVTYPHFSIGSINFSNVVDIYCYSIDTLDTTQYSQTFNCSYFLNDSIGLVKMRINHPYRQVINHVWELQRYNIVK